MVLNRKEGETSLSDDLLTLLQRLKDSVSGTSSPSHANGEHEGGASTHAMPNQTVGDGPDVSSATNFEPLLEPQSSLSMEESQPERPERYANPIRTIALGGATRNRQRVLSNSNLVGAPPPQVPVGGYPIQRKSGGTLKDLIKDPVIAVLVLISVMVFVFVGASLTFVLSGSTEVQRAVPLPSSSIVQGVGSSHASRIIPPTPADAPEVVPPVSKEEVVPVETLTGTEHTAENPVEPSAGKQDSNLKEEKPKDQRENSTPPIALETTQENYRWIVEIAAVTKQPDYERLIVQLQKAGFNPIVRVENLPSGIEAFRLEIREAEMNEALVRMSQLKRLKCIDPENLVMKPAQGSNRK